MSRTFEIVCDETKQKLWIGQGSVEMTNFYTSERETMDRLRRFFIQTKGKCLTFKCTDIDGGDWHEYEDFE